MVEREALDGGNRHRQKTGEDAEVKAAPQTGRSAGYGGGKVDRRGQFGLSGFMTAYTGLAGFPTSSVIRVKDWLNQRFLGLV